MRVSQFLDSSIAPFDLGAFLVAMSSKIIVL